MKRMIRATETYDGELFDLLSEDLSNSFEDNIVVRYAQFEDLDPHYAQQKKMYDELTKARLAYLRAIENVIKHVDVNDFV